MEIKLWSFLGWCCSPWKGCISRCPNPCPWWLLSCGHAVPVSTLLKPKQSRMHISSSGHPCMATHGIVLHPLPPVPIDCQGSCSSMGCCLSSGDFLLPLLLHTLSPSSPQPRQPCGAKTSLSSPEKHGPDPERELQSWVSLLLWTCARL